MYSQIICRQLYRHCNISILIIRTAKKLVIHQHYLVEYINSIYICKFGAGREIIDSFPLLATVFIGGIIWQEAVGISDM